MEILIGLLLALILGIVPMVVYALILWWFDRYEKEPLLLLFAAFAWGAIPAIIFSLIVEIILGLPMESFVDPAAAEVIGAALVAPVVEEAFKGAILWAWLLAAIVNHLLRRFVPQVFENRVLRVVLWVLFPPFFQEFDSALDGIIYGGLVGFGFAAMENIFYLLGALFEGGIGELAFLALLRGFVFGLNHALFTGLTGLGLALARNARNWLLKIASPVVGLGLGMLAHAIHNGTVSFGQLCWPCLITFLADYGGVLLLFVVIIWATVRERSWIVIHLKDEVGMGTLSKGDYEVVSSYLKRVATRAGALFRADLKGWWRLGRYYRLATELAFNKHRLSRFPEGADTRERIAELREQVMELGGGPRPAGREQPSQPEQDATSRVGRYCASCGRGYRSAEDDLTSCPVCGAPRAEPPASHE